MAKKLVAVIVSAVFLIGACVFGFVYSGLDANFPKAESKVKIVEPEFMMVFLENTPNFDDYYRGAVKSGEYNGKSFHTFSISGRYMVNQTTEKGNGDNPKNTYAMSRMDVAYGTDACFSTVECYYVEDNQDDKNELDIRIDIYATENIFYYRVRKFDFNTLFFSEAGEVGSKIEQLLKKCFQSHLNEWIDGSSILQEHTGSDMEQALYDSIVAYTAGIWPLMTNAITDELQRIINDYETSKEKQTRTGGVILWEDVDENESGRKITSNRIDLTGVSPYFEQRTDMDRYNEGELIKSSWESTHYDVFGFDSTKVKKPRRVIDMRSVYSELIDFLMEELNNGGNEQ